MIEILVMGGVGCFALGFLACLGLWHRATADELEQIGRVDRAFDDYVAIVNRHEMPSDWR